MAAPSNTVWGNSIVGDKSTRQGQIGISTTTTNSTTSVSVKVQVWFRSMYSLQDSNNSYYYNAASSATTLIGSRTINHTVNSGGAWSESNQTLLGEYSYTYVRSTSVQTKYFSAKFTGIDNLGESNVTSVSVSVSIPTLLPLAIRYDANGGSGAPDGQTKYYGINIVLSSTVPTRTGYTFQSWNTNANGTGTSYAPGATYTGNTELTLYAIWKANTYTITYNANGGTGGPTTQTKTYGVPLTITSTVPIRENYAFKGWSTSASGGVSYSSGSSYTTNAPATLYAVWELSYVKPRIWGLKVTRCDQNRTDDDNGTYARVEFSWSTDKPIDSPHGGYTIEWTSESASSGIEMFTPSGTSGTESKLIGGSLSADSTYTIKITLWDEQGSGAPEYNSYAFSTLPGIAFPIDILEDVGIAFGKPAELEGVADFGWKARFNEGLLPPVLPPETDLDDIFTPNTYIGANITDNVYVNCPVSTGTFTLVVISGGEHGQVRQEFISCDMSRPRRFVRFYHSKSDGTQGWGDWMNGSTEEIVLYENSSGTVASFNIPAPNISDYQYLEIYYTDNNGLKGGYTKIQNPAFGDYICLSIIEAAAGGIIYFRETKYQITANVDNTKTVFNLKTCGYTTINTGTKTVGTSSYGTDMTTNYIKIKKIVGRV